jgi:hypothetical protein
MKRISFTSCIFITIMLIACNSQPSTENNVNLPATKEDIIKRGEYLVQITGCNDCHSPKTLGKNGPEIIPELLLSGYSKNTALPHADKKDPDLGIISFAADLTAAKGPWGTSFAANLTPDTSTGLGGWSEAQFKIALTRGKYKGVETGRPLLPPMPWFNYVNMKDDDVKAIFAYLKSIKPVTNAVPLPLGAGS